VTAGHQTPTEICVGYLEAFATGDVDRITSFVTDDFINEHTAALGSGCEGIDEYRRRVPYFLATMPALRYDVEDVIADGDRVWAAYTLRASVNERPIEIRGVMRFVVREGRIAHRIDYWDSWKFQQQAGMV